MSRVPGSDVGCDEGRTIGHSEFPYPCERQSVRSTAPVQWQVLVTVRPEGSSALRHSSLRFVPMVVIITGKDTIALSPTDALDQLITGTIRVRAATACTPYHSRWRQIHPRSPLPLPPGPPMFQP